MLRFHVKILLFKLPSIKLKPWVTLSYMEKYQWYIKGRARTVKEQVML